MRNVAKKAAAGLLAPAVSMALLLGAVDAQEVSSEAQDLCTAEVTPQPVEAGQQAVRVNVTLSEEIGQVEKLEAKGESGVELAEPADIEKTAMAREGEEKPQPIVMSREDRTKFTLWLNTENAEAGGHEVTLEGQDGQCSARIQVAGERADVDAAGSGR